MIINGYYLLWLKYQLVWGLPCFSTAALAIMGIFTPPSHRCFYKTHSQFQASSARMAIQDPATGDRRFLVIWGLPKMGVPLVIIHFGGIFPYKPSSYWGTPMTSWKAPFSRPSSFFCLTLAKIHSCFIHLSWLNSSWKPQFFKKIRYHPLMKPWRWSDELGSH